MEMLTNLCDTARLTKSKTITYFTPTGDSGFEPKLLKVAQDAGVRKLKIWSEINDKYI